MKHLPVLLALLLLAGCPPIGLDDDDSGGTPFDDDDATGDDDDDATGDDDDATGDDDDATGDDDDATGDDDDSTAPASGPITFDVGFSCGFNVSATTTSQNNQTDGYAACGLGATGWPGGEYVGVVGSANTQHTLTLTWTDASADLDLIVLDGNDPTSSGCYGSSTSSTGTSESVVFTLPSGNGWVVVDSKGAAGAAFSLSISCP